MSGTGPRRAAERGIPAPPNLADTVGHKVVRLPTAAARKVKQRWNRETRAVAMPMREQWRGRFILPAIRKQMETAELVDSLTLTPGLALAHAIFAALDESQQRKVKTTLAIGAACGRKSFAQARALVLATDDTAPLGDRVNLDAALRILRGEG